MPTPNKRRPKRLQVFPPLSLPEHIYDFITIAFLFSPSVLGMFLYGATRMWSIGPLMMVSYLGVALFCLKPLLFDRDQNNFQIPPGGIIFFFIFGYGFLHVFLASGSYEAHLEWLKLGSYVGVYWAWSKVSSRKNRGQILLGVLILSVSLMAWYAIIQHAKESIMVLNIERPEGYGMRASGTYVCPNHFAGLLEIVMCMALAMILMPSASIPLRTLALYGMVLFVPVLFLTQSRSGLVGAGVGLSVTGLLIAWEKNKRLFCSSVVFIPLLFVLLVGKLWYVSPVFQQRVAEMNPSELGGTALGRIAYWKDTIEMIKDKPFLGYGPGSFRWIYSGYKSSNLEQLWLRYAHNEYLQTIAEYGFVGFFLFIGFVFAIVFSLLKTFRNPSRSRNTYLIAGLAGSISATLTHACFDFNLHIFSITHVLMMLAGTVFGVLYASQDLTPQPLVGFKKYVFCGGSCALALVLFGLTVQAFVADRLYIKAESYRKELKMPDALKMFRYAGKVDNDNWLVPMGIGRIYAIQSFWSRMPERKKTLAERSVKSYKKAYELNPFDMRVSFGLGQAYITLGEHEKGLEWMRRAANYAKYEFRYHRRLGIELRRLGKDEEALEVFRWARRLKPSDETVQLNIKMLTSPKS
ncbi:MAG: hypothetical protein GKR87_06675 [Kiritimatiellae bacterium]|nr:hypothetical protein [Kiritimatiellia bacterium]